MADFLGFKSWRMKKNPDEVRRSRLELRKLGSSYGIQFPTIDRGPGNYRKEHEALMIDFALTVAALRKIEAESPEKYIVIREAAKKVLEISKPYIKVKEEKGLVPVPKPPN